MRTLYLDCGMGAAGDMLTASLLQLFSEPVKQVKKLNDLKIPGVKYQLVACTRGGIRGYQVRVFVKGQEEENLHMQTEEHVGHKSAETEKHTQEHGHHSMSQIVRLINRLKIEDQVKQDAVAVYKLIAKAEGKAHGQRMDEIHFHEVGTMDAVADVVPAVQRQHIIRFHQCLQAVGHMLLTDGHGAVRQLPRDIGEHIFIVSPVAVPVVSDGVDDQLLCGAIIVIETIERCRITFRPIGRECGEDKLDEIPDGRNKGTDVVKIHHVVVDVFLVGTSGIFARSQEAKHLVIKQLALFLAALSATKQIQQSQGDFRIAVPIIALEESFR